MIKVLIVDDSHVESELISYMLKSDHEINIIGIASSGEEAISMIKKERPDVITMDINMPGIDGFEATRKIMETTPLPIVIVTAACKNENINLSFRAMEAGALTLIEKSSGPGSPDYVKKKNELINTVKLMSEIKVVSRRAAKPRADEKNGSIGDIRLNNDIDIIVVGASTGGPHALQKFLKGIKGDFIPPVMVVQHITKGFTAGFADWLSVSCDMNVRIPENMEKINRDTVYVAPDDFHMGIDRDGLVVLSGRPPIKNLRPSVAYLFRSAAESYGSRAVGVILTGMGSDGAEDLKFLRDRGALTFAQNEESSVVFGMPGEAIKLGGAVFVLTPEGISGKIRELLKKR